MIVSFLFCFVAVLAVGCDAGDRPRLEGLTETEIKYAWLYWDYNTTERVVRAGPHVEVGPRLVKLGYRFLVPLSERLAGISYVGHAARLRLALERARKGKALRVGAVGGSITAGQAVGGGLHTYASTFVEWLNAALPPRALNDIDGVHHLPQEDDWEVIKDGSGAGADSGLGELQRGADNRETSEVGVNTALPGPEQHAGPAGGSPRPAAMQWSQRRSLRGGESRTSRLIKEEPDHDQVATRQQQEEQHRAYMSRRCLELRQAGPQQDPGGQKESLLSQTGPQHGNLPVRSAPRHWVVRRRRLFQDPLEDLLRQHQRQHPQHLRLQADTAGDSLLPGAAAAHRQAAMLVGGGGVLVRQARTLRNEDAEPDSAAKRPRPRHQYINGAVPGTESGYASSCLDHHLPAGLDIVMVEYAVNDPPVPSRDHSDPARRAMERLVRKLLHRPSQPAVLMVNMFALKAAKGRYWHNAERDFTELATYYSLPSVSLKAAVMPPSSTDDGVAASAAVSPGAIYNGGMHHPGRGGHVVVAEVLTTMVLELLHSNSHMHEGHSGYQRNTALEGMDPRMREMMQAVAERPLPRPLAEGNYESTSNTCYLARGLQALAVAPVEGWSWTDEGRGKWGWVATEPEKTLRVKVSTVLAGNRSAEAQAASVVVQVAYLQSYSGMGTALVECQSGCSCEPVVVDAFNDDRLVSTTNMKDVRVSQHPECVMALTTKGSSAEGKRAEAEASAVAAATGGAAEGAAQPPAISAGDKFKLMGVVVGEEPGASEGTVTWVRPETFGMSQLLHHGTVRRTQWH